MVVVKGGELGSQHRDMIYALFRMKNKITSYRTRNPDAPSNGTTDGVPSHIDVVESIVSWRDLLRTMGKTEHVNNLLTAKNVMEDLRQIMLTIYEGDPDEVMKQLQSGRLPRGAGRITGVIDLVEWDGANLDSKVTVRWGKAVMTAFRNRQLVSLNAEVQFALKSDYARASGRSSIPTRPTSTSTRRCWPTSSRIRCSATPRPTPSARSSARIAVRRSRT